MVTRSMGNLTGATGPLDWVALLMGISTLVIVMLIRQQLPARGPGQSPEDWWQAQLGRMVLLWSMLEFPAVIGAITLFVTHHAPVFGLLAALAMGGLIGLSPARLSGE